MRRPVDEMDCCGRSYTLYQVDAFTRSKFKGNPAGVVLNADGLTEEEMRCIARELNNSETAFLLRAEDNDHDGRIRYFTPRVEVPTCGHATIAAMVAKALEENLDACVLKMKTRIGILPFEIQRSGEDVKVWMTQGEVQIGSPLPAEVQREAMDCLGLSTGDLDERCPMLIASTGHSKVMIGIKDRGTLNRLTPDMAGLKVLSRKIGCSGYFVFTLTLDDPDIQSHGRMFAPAIGIEEDPVTGNANGPLGAYLVYNGLAETEAGVFSFKGYQGEAMGREGCVEVRVSVENGKPVLVKIGGEAVVVFRTVMTL